MTDDKNILDNIVLLNRFFDKERKKNVSIIRSNYSMSTDDAEDIYQDACIALFQNIQEGRLVKLTAKLSSYFTQICVYQALKKIRDSKHTVDIHSSEYDQQRVQELLDIGGDFTVSQQLGMAEMVKAMPEPCRTILWAFHYENKSMAEIASLVNFAGADSVKSKKTQCLTKLKNAFRNRINELKDGE